MKKIFHKGFSILMACVVLFSTMSFTISSHYCGDRLVDSSVFSKLETCGMESYSQKNHSLKNSDCSITKKNCCTDENEIIKGQNELQLSFQKFSFDQQLFVAAFVYTYIHLFPTVDEGEMISKTFHPPLIVRHIYKLDETYLI